MPMADMWATFTSKKPHCVTSRVAASRALGPGSTGSVNENCTAPSSVVSVAACRRIMTAVISSVTMPRMKMTIRPT